MVRLIKLIEQGLKNGVRFKGRQKAPTGPPADEFSLDQEHQGVFETDQMDAERFREWLMPSNVEQKKHAFELYDMGLKMARHICQQARALEDICPDAIDAVLDELVNVFHADTYHPLLILSYSYTGEDYLPGHMVNGLLLTLGFSRSLGMDKDKVKSVGRLALLHDAGMVNFSKIYNVKRRLSHREFKKITQHPGISLEVCGQMFSRKEKTVLLDIHEREMGQGYPNGDKGADILPWAKIIAICDIFEALTHPRPYRGEYTPFEAMKMLIRMKGDILDDGCLRAFLEFMSAYPVGSIVFLSTGEVAVVNRGNPGSPTNPVVQVLYGADHRLDEEKRVINLADQDLIYIKGVVDRDKERELFFGVNRSLE